MSPVDPIAIQVLAGALASACEEMGAVLIRSAHSANIKERRDCSAALFTASGEMAMQAEHIPVHLGSMPASVAAVLDRDHRPGQSWILNDPYSGGTHLPDITLITPSFDDAGRLLGFAANRAHHADVGGSVPGSMPADSKLLEEEGVIISPRVLDDEAIAMITASMRQPEQRRADLRAQLAANRVGTLRLREIADAAGSGFEDDLESVISYAERRVRSAIATMPDGTYEADDWLEGRSGDLPLKLVATVAGDRIIFDFTGSSGPDQGNLNCPLSVTQSACYFAVRVLTDPDIPASAGAYRPVTVIAPENSLLNARPPHAVVAGNVETSSRVADLALAAFGCALGQGTMNNLTLGNGNFTHYETLGGGQAAGPDGDGPSAVHVAMSNTLNTPIEALEIEFPLRAIEYSVRRGSGGAGIHRGGDGLVRDIEALEPMEFALLTERRRHRPPGSDGGNAASLGINLLIDSDGITRQLEPKTGGELRPGDRLRIETPGGGGFGAPEEFLDPEREGGPDRHGGPS